MRVDIPLGNFLSLYLFSPSKIALFLYFSNKILRVLQRLVWSQNSYKTLLLLQLLNNLRSFNEWESISLCLSGSVEIQGHAMAETPTGVAHALLFIVWGYSQKISLLFSSFSSLINLTYKLFYHIFYQLPRLL